MPSTAALAESDRVAYAIPQVAELLYVYPRQVFRLMKDGLLKATRLGGRRLILRSELDRSRARRLYSGPAPGSRTARRSSPGCSA
jgi:excisionase family DNA binding protein